MSDWRKIITVEPGKMGGQPCVRGMRMRVKDVLEYMAGGMSDREILDDFPYLTQDDLNACRAWDLEQRRTVKPSPDRGRVRAPSVR